MLIVVDSFSNLEGQAVPMILVGTKCDEEENRKVKTEIAQKYVDELFKECSFIETSAKTNHNVQEAFQVFGDWILLSPDPLSRTTAPCRSTSAWGCCCRLTERRPSHWLGGSWMLMPQSLPVQRFRRSAVVKGKAYSPSHSDYRSVFLITNLSHPVVPGTVVAGQESQSLTQAGPKEIASPAEEGEA